MEDHKHETILLKICYLLLLSAIYNEHFVESTTTTETSMNRLCNCQESIDELSDFIMLIDERLSFAINKITELTTLQHSFSRFKRENAVQHDHLTMSIKKIWQKLKSYNKPVAESLVREPETSSTYIADEPTRNNFTVLIEGVNDKLKEMKSFSSEVTELQQENKVLKQEIEKEKRVRRSLQNHVYVVEEGLNQTQSLVLEIKEIVSGKDSSNSSIEEVAEIVFAKIAEFDVLNKSEIENQLKKLEYKVKNVFRNELRLVQRLDSVENVSSHAVGLLENESLLDKVHNISNSILTLEVVQSQQKSDLSHLEVRLGEVNSSLTRKLTDVEGNVFQMDLSKNGTMVTFESELSGLNDTWNNKSEAIRQELSAISEKISETDNEMRNAINGTQETIVFLKSIHVQAISNISAIQEEIENTHTKLAQLSGELTSTNSILNRTVDKDKFYGLWDNLTEQSTKLQNQITSQEQFTRDVMENFVERFQNAEWEQSVAFETLENKTFRNLEAMETLLLRQIDAHRDEIADLKVKMEESMSFFRPDQVSTSVEDDEDISSRMRIGVEETTTEGLLRVNTTEDPRPCVFAPQAPFTDDKELVIAYRREGLYEELEDGTSIPHGEFLHFSCRKIGRYILVGSQTIACLNGQWGDGFPRCKKLLDETEIKDAIGKSADPCLESRGQFPDPTDCSKYYNCWDDQRYLEKCRNGLHFNAGSKKCDYPQEANCSLNHDVGKLADLTDIIPPIYIGPPGVGVANSLLATSVTGELVVYPKATVHLICLYPRELGEPQWEVFEKVSHPHIPAWDISGGIGLKNAYKLKLTISPASEDDSGNFTCVTPFGQSHTIRILVKEIACPDFVVDEESHVTVFYRPQPEGLQKVMTTEVSFQCDKGYSLNGSSTAMCKASGLWSHLLPSCHQEEITGCRAPDLDNRPGLYISNRKSSYSFGETVNFKCEYPRHLLGNMSARCLRNGTWGPQFPHCRTQTR